MSKDILRRTRRCLITCLVSLLVGGVHAQQSTSGFYEDARQRYYENDPAAALIQLKNALQLDGQHVPSLVLMGELLLEEREFAAAEHVFTEALLLGADGNFVAPKLASAYMGQGKYTELITSLPIEGVHGLTRAELLGYHALAYLSLNDLQAAKIAIADADKINPDALIPNIARVNWLITEKSLDDALRTARRLTVNWPDLPDSWTRLGLVLQAQGKNEAALDAYAASLLRNPGESTARLSRAALLVDMRRDTDAAIDIETYQAAYPLDARGVYLHAQIMSRAGDENAAKQALQEVAAILQALPAEQSFGDQQLAMIGAQANYRLGNFEITRKFLIAYLKHDPNNLQAVLMLTSSLLELGQANRAVDVLEPIYILNKDDSAVIGMMATAYTRAGQFERANRLFLRLSEQLLPGSGVHTQIALNRLSVGQTTEGLTALDEIYLVDKSRLDAGFSLAVTYLDMGRAKDAALIATELLEHAPDTPAFLNLLGLAEFASGHTDKARDAFLSAEKADPSFAPAQIGLARVDRVSGKFDTAEKRIESLLKTDAGNVTAMMEMARLELSRDNVGPATNWAEEAGRADAGDVRPRLLLIELLKETDQLEAAEEVAWQTVVGFDDNLGALAALANVQATAGKHPDSLQTYRRMQKIAGFNTDQLYRIALLQMRPGGWEDARFTLYMALKGRPSHLPSMLAILRVHLALRQFDEALQIANSMLEIDSNSAEVLGLRANTLLAMQSYEMADRGFRDAIAANYDPRWVVGRYRSMLAQKLPKQAENVLRETLERQPQDFVVRGALADHLLEEQRWAQAKLELEILLKQHPQHSVHLNNMAYTLNELGEPGALEFARRAHEIDPDSGSINDTLGWVLVSGGANADALPYLREASSRSAHNPQIKYHLSVALHNLGRQNEAQLELQQALSSGGNFPEREAARQLMRALKSAE